MVPRKPHRPGLRSLYPIMAEIGLIFSFLLLIVAFRIQLSSPDAFVIPDEPVHEIKVDPSIVTEHIRKPPPPPRPPVPIEVPNDTELETEVIDVNPEIDLEKPLSIASPPKPLEPEEPEIFEKVEFMPAMISTLQVQYPEIAKKAGIEGTVFIQFVVDEQGNVVDPVVLKGIGGGCDEAALEAVRSARFKPGMQRDKPVKVRMSMPIRFRLR